MKQTKHLKKTIILASFITVGILSMTSCNNSRPQDDTIKSSNTQNTVSHDSVNKSDDAQFIVKVAKINLEEIQLGELAEGKGTMKDVKEMGKMMVEDHTKAQNELTELAKKSITIPISIDSKAKDDYSDLNKKSGVEFDKKYSDMMVSGHKDAISLFEKDSAKSNDTDIKQLAISTLPTLRKHLNHALMCQESCKNNK